MVLRGGADFPARRHLRAARRLPGLAVHRLQAPCGSYSGVPYPPGRGRRIRWSRWLGIKILWRRSPRRWRTRFTTGVGAEADEGFCSGWAERSYDEAKRVMDGGDDDGF